jgi:hypothetical protein
VNVDWDRMAFLRLSSQTESIGKSAETEACDFALGFPRKGVVNADEGPADVPEFSRPLTAPVFTLESRDKE